MKQFDYNRIAYEPIDFSRPPTRQAWGGGEGSSTPFDNEKYAVKIYKIIDVLIASGNGRVKDRIKCPICGLYVDLGPRFDMKLCKCSSVIRHYGDRIEVTVERFQRRRLSPSYVDFHYFFNGKRVTKDEYDREYALHLLTHS